MINLHPAFGQSSIQHCRNHGKLNPGNYPDSLYTAIDTATINQAIEVISQWPGYKPTPLHSLESLAPTVSVASIYYKDESSHVLVFGAEGATDPEIYEQLTGIYPG